MLYIFSFIILYEKLFKSQGIRQQLANKLANINKFKDIKYDNSTFINSYRSDMNKFKPDFDYRDPDYINMISFILIYL